jgi:hypothetical protein
MYMNRACAVQTLYFPDPCDSNLSAVAAQTLVSLLHISSHWGGLENSRFSFESCHRHSPPRTPSIQRQSSAISSTAAAMSSNPLPCSYMEELGNRFEDTMRASFTLAGFTTDLRCLPGSGAGDRDGTGDNGARNGCPPAEMPA